MCLLPLLPEHTHPITTMSEEGMGARALGRGSFLLSSYASVTQSGCPVFLPPHTHKRPLHSVYRLLQKAPG